MFLSVFTFVLHEWPQKLQMGNGKTHFKELVFVKLRYAKTSSALPFLPLRIAVACILWWSFVKVENFLTVLVEDLCQFFHSVFSLSDVALRDVFCRVQMCFENCLKIYPPLVLLQNSAGHQPMGETHAFVCTWGETWHLAQLLVN